MPYVSGMTRETASRTAGISSRGMSSPPVTSCGKMITGIICTAWNSVRATADAARPRAVPSTASRRATSTTTHSAPATRMPHTPTAKAVSTSACTTATAPNASAYPSTTEPRVTGVVMSRSRVPDCRSRSVATLVTRNITMSGKRPSSSGPNWSRTGVPSNIQAMSPTMRHGSPMSRAMVRGSLRIWRSTRPAVATVSLIARSPHRRRDRPRRRRPCRDRRPGPARCPRPAQGRRPRHRGPRWS